MIPYNVQIAKIHHYLHRMYVSPSIRLLLYLSAIFFVERIKTLFRTKHTFFFKRSFMTQLRPPYSQIGMN